MRVPGTVCARLSEVPFVLLAFAVPVFAEATEATSGVDSSGIETIHVTATRRTSDAQDLPLAINAFGEEELERSRVSTLSDLQFLVSGMKVATVSGLARVSLRGIGTNGISPTAEAGVSTFIDGVYLGSAYHQSRAFFDVERIEVLRGPQGTLYGRNATGGAINIITNASSDVLEAGADVTMGNEGLFETQGYLGGPLVGDWLSGRLALRTERHDAYTENLAGSDLDDGDVDSIRGRLSFRLTDALSLDLTADYSDDESALAIPTERADPDVPTLYEILGGLRPTGRRVAWDVDSTNDTRTYGYTGTIVWDLDWATLTSITAYRDARSTVFTDFDFTSLPVAAADSKVEVDQTTQDIYLTSPDDGRFQWLVGASYFREDTYSSIFADLGIGTLFLSSPDMETEAYAAYAEGTWRITESLELAAGARYAYEEKSFRESDVYTGLFSPIAPAPFPLNLGPVDDSWNEVSPHVSLSYFYRDALMFYVSVARGFKAGGYNSLSNQLTAFDPEVNTSYEVGIKSEFPEQRTRLNFDVFRMDYDDLQVQQRLAIPGSQLTRLVISNAAEARVYGAELELLADPTDWLSIDGNLTYLDPTYQSYDAIDELTPGTPTVDVSGNQMNGAPEWSANLGAQISYPFSNFEVTLRGEYSYQSEVFNNPTNSPALRQDAYDWFNARLSVTSLEGSWRVAAWIKNITDEEVFGLRSPSAMDAVGGQPILGWYVPPRTYGVTIGWDLH